LSYWRHLRAIVLLPALATIVVPSLIIWFAGPRHAGWGLSLPLAIVVVALGATLVMAGLALLTWTNVLFQTEGSGTLAPWDATRRLVARGVYRHARNPMITGVSWILLGEVALLPSPFIPVWAALFIVLNAFYIPLVEEPDLERRFGDD